MFLHSNNLSNKQSVKTLKNVSGYFLSCFEQKDKFLL